MFSILPPSFYSLFSQLTFLPSALASPPPPKPLLAEFNNSLSVARWRHLAPPQDTGHSVWVQEGLRGVEGVEGVGT